MNTSKVFLGGTCNNSTWRDELIKQLEISYYNPVVENWTPACMDEERKQRTECDYCLYVITPEMTGVYAIAEAVDDSNKQPKKTIFCFVDEYGGHKFNQGQIKSLNEVGKMIARNGGYYLSTIEIVAMFLNSKGCAGTPQPGVSCSPKSPSPL